jgi:hypothetical protein
MKTQPPERDETKRERKDMQEHLTYPASDDIYNKAQKEDAIDPDDLTKRKSKNLPPDEWNEKDFKEAVSGSDLDVPGSETNEGSRNGEEDEENDYYSRSQDQDRS